MSDLAACYGARTFHSGRAWRGATDCDGSLTASDVGDKAVAAVSDVGAPLGRRGPGTGLRQARTTVEAAHWRCLFGALASPQAECVLPHLGLRTGDEPAVREAAAQVYASLSSIMARTRGSVLVERVNIALAAAYADLKRCHGARLARSVFALGGDGFPGRDAAAQFASWDAALRRLAGDDEAAAGMSAAKRDVVVALVGHHLAGMQPLDGIAAAGTANGRQAPGAVAWLVTLARWRRYAKVRRALARVLTPAERQRLAL